MLTIGSKELEVIEEVGEWDYSWTIGALLREPATGLFFFLCDSGCSCTYFGMDVTEEDLVLLRIPSDAVGEARKCSFSDEEVCTFSQRIAARDWR